MKILPNIHFWRDFKQHYAENYEQDLPKVEHFAEDVKKFGESVKDGSLKTKILGKVKAVILSINWLPVIFFIVFVCTIVFIYLPMSRRISEVQTDIDSVKTDYDILCDEIQKYRNLKAVDPRRDLEIVAYNIELLQNQYLAKGQLTDEYRSAAYSYFGDDHNYDWASKAGDIIRSKSQWVMYVDKACEFVDEATIIAVLYSDGNMICAYKVTYSLDDLKCADKMTSLVQVL